MNKKNILAGKAIAALLLASSIPMNADAASNFDMKDARSARGGCGAASPRGGCGAAPEQQPMPHQPNGAPSSTPATPNTPPKSGCGAQASRPSNQNRPTASCGAQQTYYRPSAACGAYPTRPTAACGAAASDSSQGMRPLTPEENNRMMMQRQRQQTQMPPQQGSTTSYQGTSTGPGPNGGYPETPRGTYHVQPGSRY